MEGQWPMWSDRQQHQQGVKQPEASQSPMLKRVVAQKAPWRSASPLSANTEMLFGAQEDSNPGSRRSRSPLVACRGTDDLSNLNDLSDAEAIHAVTGKSSFYSSANSDAEADKVPDTSENSSNSAFRKVPELPPRNYSCSQLRKDSGVSVVESEVPAVAPASKLPPILDQTAPGEPEEETRDSGTTSQQRENQPKQQQRQRSPPSHHPRTQAVTSLPPSPPVGRHASVPQDLQFLQDGCCLQRQHHEQQQQQKKKKKKQGARERGHARNRVWQLLLQPIQRLGRSRSPSPLQEGACRGRACSHDSKGKRGYNNNNKKKKARKQGDSNSGKNAPLVVSTADAKRGYAVPQDALLDSDANDISNNTHGKHAFTEYALVAARPPRPPSPSRVSSCSPHIAAELATPPPPLDGTATINRGPAIDNAAPRRASQDESGRARPPHAQARQRSNTVDAAVYDTPAAPVEPADKVAAAAAAAASKQEVEPNELFNRIYNQIPSRQERRGSDESPANHRQHSKGMGPMLRRKHQRKGELPQPRPQQRPRLAHQHQAGKQGSAPFLRATGQAVHAGQHMDLPASPCHEPQQHQQHGPGVEAPEYDNGDLCAEVCYAMAGDRARRDTDHTMANASSGRNDSNFNNYQLVRATEAIEGGGDPIPDNGEGTEAKGRSTTSKRDSISEYFEAGLYTEQSVHSRQANDDGDVVSAFDGDGDDDGDGDGDAQRAEPVYSKVDKKRRQGPGMASIGSIMSIYGDGYAKVNPQ